MKHIKKIGIVLCIVLIIWAVVNPYLFTMKESDEGAIHAFNEKGLSISFHDFKAGNNTPTDLERGAMKGVDVVFIVFKN